MEVFMKTAAVFLLPLLGFSVACINSNATPGAEIFQDLPARDFAEKIKNAPADKYTILDIRTKAEYDQIHLKDAVNLDFYASDFRSQLDQLDKTRIYFIYCRSGKRSGNAVKIMKQLKFKEVYNLAGGISTDTDQLPLAAAD